MAREKTQNFVGLPRLSWYLGSASGTAIIHISKFNQHKEITMRTQFTRRHFIEITSFASMTALTACSKKNEPASATATSPAPAAPVAAPAPAPAQATVPTSAPASEPTAATNFPMLDEKDGQAMALGYVADAHRADKIKFNNYVAGNQCSNCANYVGKASDSAAGCKIFPGKNVTAKGWCTAWIKMA